jgi:hypothetical protein
LKLGFCSWAQTEHQALQQAHQGWRWNALGGDLNWDLPTPAHFEAATRFVRPEDMRETVHVSADLGRHSALLAECAELGFESIDLHQVGGDQHAFIEAFGRSVLPQLRPSRGATHPSRART